MLNTFLIGILVVDTHAKNGDKAKIPENTEMIFLDTFLRITDKLDAPVGEVLKAVKVVVYFAIWRCVESQNSFKQ